MEKRSAHAASGGVHMLDSGLFAALRACIRFSGPDCNTVNDRRQGQDGREQKDHFMPLQTADEQHRAPYTFDSMRLHSWCVLAPTVLSVAQTGGVAWHHYGLIGKGIGGSVNNVLLCL